MTVMTGAAHETGRTASPARDPADDLFRESLVVSQPHKRTRRQRIGDNVSFVAHVLIVAGVVFVPLFMPDELPDQGDRRVVFFDPPPPPPPPLPRGSPLQPAAGEAGHPEARHREQAEAGVHRPDRDPPAAGDGQGRAGSGRATRGPVRQRDRERLRGPPRDGGGRGGRRRRGGARGCPRRRPRRDGHRAGHGLRHRAPARSRSRVRSIPRRPSSRRSRGRCWSRS